MYNDDEVDIQGLDSTANSAKVMLQFLLILPWGLFCITTLEPFLGLNIQNAVGHLGFVAIVTGVLLFARKSVQKVLV